MDRWVCQASASGRRAPRQGTSRPTSPVSVLSSWLSRPTSPTTLFSVSRVVQTNTEQQDLAAQAMHSPDWAVGSVRRRERLGLAYALRLRPFGRERAAGGGVPQVAGRPP